MSAADPIDEGTDVDWVTALDLFEQGLAHHSTLVAKRQVEGDNPWPPERLPAGPVPPELQARAERLLRESHRVMDEMAGMLADLPPRRPVRNLHRDTPDQPRWSLSL